MEETLVSRVEREEGRLKTGTRKEGEELTFSCLYPSCSSLRASRGNRDQVEGRPGPHQGKLLQNVILPESVLTVHRLAFEQTVEVKKQRNKSAFSSRPPSLARSPSLAETFHFLVFFFLVATNKTRIVKKVVPTDSFFNFFSPPSPPTMESLENGDVDEEELEALDERLELDYQIGEDLKERIIRESPCRRSGSDDAERRSRCWRVNPS
jgi:hypothetical protein